MFLVYYISMYIIIIIRNIIVFDFGDDDYNLKFIIILTNFKFWF